MPNINYEIIIPAYNAGKFLQQLLDQIKNLPLSYKPKRIRVIDDGSKDNTPNIALNNEVQLLSIPENKGKGFALKAGFKEFLETVDCDYVLCMDADLQHPVSSAIDFMHEIEKNSPMIVIGARERKTENMPFLRILSNGLSSWILTKCTQKNIKDGQCGFRAIHKNVLNKVNLKEDGFQLETEFILKAARAGFDFNFIKIPTIYNKSLSNIKHIGDTYKFIKLVLNDIRLRYDRKRQN
ncbi:MAG: glycosyltransferase family 2 protein [Calditrichaceae bacterium]|nr:glycosyltransferase family 2 protein [Calditrichaceae bacterium]MBN2709877.1 glycosyltransferase family 2 protein [Calditrichaceae bacterium]RQV92633.1 MAG: glycosyltransferase family 2 protein [Calditrichota bacterium]